MAPKRFRMNNLCSICLDPVNPVMTTYYGLGYCYFCIKSFGDREDEDISSCPQTVTPGPNLMKNTTMDDLAQELKKTGLQAAESTERQGEMEVSQLSIQQRIRDREKEVELLQQEIEAVNHSADKAVKDSEKIFTKLIRDVKQQVRSQQKREVRRVRELQEKLEQEITELRRRDIQDHSQFLPPPLSESTSSINIHSLCNFEVVTAAVSEVRDKLQDVLREKLTNISQISTEVPQPEPKTRDEFLKYSREITLDPNTVNTQLLLSEENRRATLMREEQPYSSHPNRFLRWRQVLSRESLTGRCYWEVEWRKKRVTMAVAYKNISREGSMIECAFGFNNKSWALECNCSSSYKFIHEAVKTHVSGPWSSKLGVYLDHSAGILSFYSVSETMTLLHRVQTTFTEPLHAGLWFSGYNGATAQFCELK